MSEWVVIQNDAMGCHYSDDDKFLETALIGDADDLISGDNDLLVFQQIGSIPILSIADFLSNFPWQELSSARLYSALLHYPLSVHEPCPLRQFIHPLW